MDYILAPLARRWGVPKKKDAVRFAEQGWMLIYYNVVWLLGMYLYYKSPYFLNMEELWTGWPQRELDGLVKGYILGQWVFLVSAVFAWTGSSMNSLWACARRGPSPDERITVFNNWRNRVRRTFGRGVYVYAIILGLWEGSDSKGMNDGDT